MEGESPLQRAGSKNVWCFGEAKPRSWRHLESSGPLGLALCKAQISPNCVWKQVAPRLLAGCGQVFYLVETILRPCALHAFMAPAANPWTHSEIWKIFACYNFQLKNYQCVPHSRRPTSRLLRLSIEALHKIILLKLAVFQVFALSENSYLKPLRSWSL